MNAILVHKHFVVDAAKTPITYIPSFEKPG